MFAPEGRAFLFEPVADDTEAAVLAGRRQRMNRAREAVEGMDGTVDAHLKRLVMIGSSRLAQPTRTTTMDGATRRRVQKSSRRVARNDLGFVVLPLFTAVTMLSPVLPQPPEPVAPKR
jgi:hypothetical protein